MAKNAVSRFAAYAFAALITVGSAGYLFAGGTQQAPASTKSSSSAVVVQMWNHQFEDYQTAWRKKWIDKFNATHTNIQVKLTIVPPNAWDQKMKAAQATGTAPDITELAYNQVIMAATNKEIQPLNNLLPAKSISDILPNVRSMVTLNGKLYAYPELVEPSMVLYYRKDLFAKAGLNPNQPPQTWAELLSDAKKLTNSNHYGLIIPYSAVELGWTLWGVRYGLTGHRLINSNWSEPLVQQEPYKELIRFWDSLYKAKVVPPQQLGSGGYVDIAPFGQGKAAMALCGSWAVGTLKNTYAKLLPDIGVTNMPTPSGSYKQATATLGGWTMGVDGKSKVAKQAAEVIGWLLGGDPAIKVNFFTMSGFSKYPVRQSTVAALKNDPAAAKDPFMKIISTRIVPYAVAEAIYPFSINLAFGHAMQRVYLQGESVDKSLNQAAADIKKIIANQNLAGTNPRH